MRNLSNLILGSFLVLSCAACTSKEAPERAALTPPRAKQANTAQVNPGKPQATKKEDEAITYATHPERFRKTQPAPVMFNIKNPKTAQEHFNVAVDQHTKHKLDTALEEYKKALELKPVWPLAHFRLGRAYQEKGNLDAAVEQWQLATRDDPNYYDAYAMLADAYRVKGDLRRAAENYEHLLGFPPVRMAVHYRLGLWYQKLGDREKARQHFESYTDMALNSKSNEAGSERFGIAVHALKQLNNTAQ